MGFRRGTIPFAGALALVFLLALGCSGEKAGETIPVVEEALPEGELVLQPVQAVCLYDGLSFWSGPSTKTGYQNYEIKKGEAVTWLGKKAKEEDDDREREYLHIRLSDGSEGWVLAVFLAVEAEPAALIEKASIYSKNNLISKTDLSYEPLDIVAVLEKQVEWVKVRGSFNTPEYWIKPGKLTFAEVDIAVAYQYMKGQEESEEKEKAERFVRDILEEEAFTDSIFIPGIQAEVQEIQARESRESEEARKVEAEAGEQVEAPLEDEESSNEP